MFFIVSGSVRVHHGDTTLATLTTGDVFGEMALLDSEKRSASVSAQCETRLLSLERDAFYGAMWDHPHSFKPLIASIIQRERKIVADITERTRELMAYQKELEIGRQIQSNFLPEAIPEIEGWEIATGFKAASEVAGDFYDAYHLSGDFYVIVLGDVCGKGVGAALFMTLFRSLLRSACIQEFATLGDSRAPEERVIAALQMSVDSTNVYVAETHATSTMFTTLFFAILDAGTGRLQYVNGGHESPILLRADGGLERLEPTGGVIGLFDIAKFEVASVDMAANDLLLVYSDGVNEAKNNQDEQYDTERILETVRSTDLTAPGVVKLLQESVAEFRGNADQSDDITMVCLNRRSD